MSEFDENNLEPSGNWSGDADDARSVAGRARARAQLESDIEEFLSRGGQIQQVDTGARPETPPRKVGVGFNNRSL